MLMHKGPLPMGVVARKILLTTGSLTYVVNQLEEKGLAHRSLCKEDGRRWYLNLTEKGAKLIHQTFPVHAEMIREMTEALTHEEQEQALELLKKLGFATQERLREITTEIEQIRIEEKDPDDKSSDNLP